MVKMKLMKKRYPGRPPLKRTPQATLARLLKKQYAAMTIIGLLMLSAGMSGFYFGTVFGYNATDTLEKEMRLLNACITFNLELPACDQIYGSIPK